MRWVSEQKLEPGFYFRIKSLRRSKKLDIRSFFKESLDDVRNQLESMEMRLFFKESLASVRWLVDYQYVNSYSRLRVNTVYGIIDEVFMGHLYNSSYAKFAFDTYFHERLLLHNSVNFYIFLVDLPDGFASFINLIPSMKLVYSYRREF